MTQKLIATLQRPKFILVLWLLLAAFAGIREYANGGYNNYQIYKYVYHHTRSSEHLYINYPENYYDSNHYGPFFSLVIMPFALLPDAMGIVLWLIVNVLILFYAIRMLPIKEKQQVLVYWLITNELFTALVNQQTNPMITGFFILAYCLIREDKDGWAAFVIMFGAFIKLYTIAALAFFFFSKNKIKLLAFSIFWSLVFFVLPMALSSPQFVVQSYFDWFDSLVAKDAQNRLIDPASIYQDFSVMGIYRRTTGDFNISSLYFLIPGIILFLVSYLRVLNSKKEVFQQLLLCSILIFVVIFSSSSESSTYIIAFSGVAVWFALHERPYSKVLLVLLVFAFVFTSLSPTVFPPSFYKEFVMRYSIKALPCVLIWLYLLYEMIFLKERTLI